MTDVMKNLVGAELFESLRGLVKKTFPDPRAECSDHLVAQVICALPVEARVALGIGDQVLDLAEHLAVEAQKLLVPTVLGSLMDATYMLAEASHERTGPGAHRFTAVLPMVRIRLPAGPEAMDVSTPFGVIFAGDHKLYTQSLVAQKYQEVFDFEVGSVYLTTPARYLGARFGAVATYEVFDTAGVRQAWILEAGMATGEAMVLFCSPHMKSIVRKVWYQPTPFSDPNYWYRGEVSFTERGPDVLGVDVCTTEELATKTPHMRTIVTYEYVPESMALPLFPARLTAEAGLRVAAIAVARGDKNPLFLLLAPFGHTLDWQKRP